MKKKRIKELKKMLFISLIILGLLLCISSVISQELTLLGFGLGVLGLSGMVGWYM